MLTFFHITLLDKIQKRADSNLLFLFFLKPTNAWTFEILKFPTNAWTFEILKFPTNAWTFEIIKFPTNAWTFEII